MSDDLYVFIYLFCSVIWIVNYLLCFTLLCVNWCSSAVYVSHLTLVSTCTIIVVPSHKISYITRAFLHKNKKYNASKTVNFLAFMMDLFISIYILFSFNWLNDNGFNQPYTSHFKESKIIPLDINSLGATMYKISFLNYIIFVFFLSFYCCRAISHRIVLYCCFISILLIPLLTSFWSK